MNHSDMINRIPVFSKQLPLFERFTDSLDNEVGRGFLKKSKLMGDTQRYVSASGAICITYLRGSEPRALVTYSPQTISESLALKSFYLQILESKGTIWA